MSLEYQRSNHYRPAGAGAGSDPGRKRTAAAGVAGAMLAAVLAAGACSPVRVYAEGGPQEPLPPKKEPSVLERVLDGDTELRIAVPEPETGRDSLSIAEEEKREEVALRQQREKAAREEEVRRARQTAEEEKIHEDALAAEEEPLQDAPASAKALASLSALEDVDHVTVSGTMRTLPDEMIRLLEEASKDYEPAKETRADTGSTDGEESDRSGKADPDTKPDQATADTNVGWVMVDLTTGGVVSYQPQYVTYSASSIKGPYIMSLLASGNKPTNDMYLAGHYSDNEAYLRIREAYGAKVMERWLADAGVDPEEGAEAYTDLTSVDLARMWCHAYDYLTGHQKNGAWLKKTFSDSYNSMISQTIGISTQTYSKAGWITPNDTESRDPEYNVYTNAGIVMEDHPYVVAVTSYNTPAVGMEKTRRLLQLLSAAHTQMFAAQ